MEKKETPDFIKVYVGLDETEPTTALDDITGGTGESFIVGAAVGSLYHFSKGLRKSKKFTTAVNAALAYGPRFGGAFSLASLAVDCPRALYRYHLYKQGVEEDKKASHGYPGLVAALAVMGGLLRVPWGLGSALRTAVACGSISAAVYALPIVCENAHFFNPELLDTLYCRPYSYPHYLPRPQKQQEDDDM